MMPDSGALLSPAAAAAAAAAVNSSRYSKRRRLDGSLVVVDSVDATDGNATATASRPTGTSGPSEAYTAANLRQQHQQWNEDAQPPRPYPGLASNASGPASAAADDSRRLAAYKPAATAATVASTSALSEGTPWHTSDTPAYPNMGPFQQQPYFYPPVEPAYNSSWALPHPQASHNSYGSLTAPSDFKANGHPAAADNMPFFPPSNTAPTAAGADSSTNAIDSGATSTFPAAFPNHDTSASQFALNQQGIAGSQPSLGVVHKDSISSIYLDDPSMHLKIQSLPILDNLATQLIQNISKASYPQVQELMRSSASEDSQAYKTLKNLFDQTRKVYSRETAFIDAIAIQMFQPNQQEIIRKANIATFISSILGAHDVTFFHLNEFFMETFVPLGHRLLKWQGVIFLELKTQIFISALMNSEGSPEEMLDELFPPDLDAQILTRHPDAPSLSPSEQDFIDRSRQRKSYLLAEPSSSEALKELPKKYQWNDFVREFASCINKNVDGIVNVPTRSQAAGNANAAGSKAGGAAMNDAVTNLIMRGSSSAGNNPLSGVSSLSLSGKSSNRESGADSSRKTAPSAPTIRQPWTKPEEDALLAGLERVNGPHWSQILALYGRGGSINEVLKDRNQVQLKDKARNLKLWYLKTGKDVPPSLQGVTGELRKRGGARARAAMGLTDSDDQQPSSRGNSISGPPSVGSEIPPDGARSMPKKKTSKK